MEFRFLFEIKQFIYLIGLIAFQQFKENMNSENNTHSILTLLYTHDILLKANFLLLYCICLPSQIGRL